MSNVTKPLSVGGRVMARLESDPEFIELMAASIMDGLKAEVMVYTKGNPEGHPKPDGRTRLEAFKQAMAYAEGLPLQRIQQAIITGSGLADMDAIKQAVASSPAMLSGLKRMLEDIETTKKPDPKRIEPAGKPT